jgi:hypothetical protein
MIGAVAMATGCAIGALVDTGRSATFGGVALLGFALAMGGLILVVQGKRVAAAIRIERGRHRLLPTAIDARRRTRARR